MQSVAVLGYGCRLPGAADVSAFWQLLVEGRCSVQTVGPDRWAARSLCHPERNVPGTTYTAAAGLLDDPFGFDAAFFGISPREAAQTDPQQRLLLHVTWEALELTGITAARLAGPRTGVYVGASGLDYGNSLAGDPAAADAKFMLGNTLSILANRVAHVLDAQGPSYVIDTACSSALFAFNAACRAIETGEIDVAVVGGVNLLLTPMPFIGFSRAAMLSPTGLCKPFDHRADGYVRAEGAVAFVIASRAWAEAGGDRIRSLVVGTAINSDGNAKPLSVPNNLRQCALMRAVYETAEVDPDAIAFLEAHGTGTAVGDPLEAQAIGEAVGQRRARPLPIGSVKSNIGHLEPAAGLAGLLKAQLALEHELLPATLHIEALNPDIPFETLNLAPATVPVPLIRGARPLVAGVNAFGFGGANAHVALRQPDARMAGDAALPEDAPLVVTAASSEALQTLAGRWREQLAGATHDVQRELVNAAAHRRTRLPHRLVVVTTDLERRLEALERFARGAPADGIVTDVALATGPRAIAFVFSGNGAQWPGMGRAAFAGDAAFRAAFERAASAIVAAGGIEAVEALQSDDLEGRLQAAETAQPLLLALQVGIVEALAERGVQPAMVAGHSFGEIAAAWASGALDLEQAAELAVRRARCQAPLFGTGGMAAVLASAEVVEALIREAGLTELDVAADNSPRSATVSGSSEAIEALAAAAHQKRIPLRRLRLDYPFHGPLMERIRAPLARALAGLAPSPSRIPFVSSTFGALRQGETLDADYWWANARQPVRFREAVLGLAERGAGMFVEIGPQPTLQRYVTDTLALSGRAVRYAATFKRHGADGEDLDVTRARVVAAGGAVDEACVFGAPLPMRHDLPAYPWSTQNYRLEPTVDGINLLRHPATRELLGWRTAPGEGPWRLALDAQSPAWLADHRVDGAVVLPAAAFVELALAAAAEVHGDGAFELIDLDIVRAAQLDAGRVDLRTHYEPQSGVVRIESRLDLADEPFALNAQAIVRRATAAVLTEGVAEVPATAADRDLYAALATLGLDYGPAFRRAARPEASAAGGLRAALVPRVIDGAGFWVLDPTALDAAFHLLAPLLEEAGGSRPRGVCYLPIRVARLVAHAPGSAVAAAEARLTRRGARTVEATFCLRAADGGLVAVAEGVRFQAVRLGRRVGGEAVFWREIERPVRSRVNAPALLPAAWAVPADRLRDLGLASDAVVAPSAGALIADAACRRIAWDAARALARRGGVGFRARRVLPPGLVRALTLGLNALAEDGAFDPDADRVGETAPVPSLEALIDALVTTAPDESDRLAAVLRLAALFEARVDGERAPASAGALAPDWDVLLRATQDLGDLWALGAPMDVLTVGEISPASQDALRSLERGRVAFVDDSDGADWRRLTQTSPFDVVLAAWDGLPEPAELRRVAGALAPGGLLLAAMPADDLLSAMLRAASGSSAGDEIDPRRLNIEALGLSAVDVRYVPDGRMRLVTARLKEDVASATAPRSNTALAILADSGGVGLSAGVALQEALSQVGRPARIVTAASDIEGNDEVVLLAGALGREGSNPGALIARFEALRRVLQAAPTRRVSIASVTNGAGRPVDEALHRIARVLANERPDLSLQVRVGHGDTANEAIRRLAEALASPLPEPALSVGPVGPSAPRVLAAGDVPQRASRARLAGDVGLRLEAGSGGGLEGLRWMPVERRAPGPSEVEIEIRATGLNFRDVMWAMGVLPEEAIEDGFAGTWLGMECAGVVCRAGAGSRFREGDRVAAFAAGAFASHVTVADLAALELPGELSFAAAASLPVAMATALYGLMDLGRLQPGETVLVHGGAGGVGLAALQIARARGARVLTTAGSAEKRLLLRLFGAAGAYDSRSLAFADEVMAATDGRGVDVALNSLAGEAMERTLACMAPFGRFVELGKRDYYAHARIGLRPMRKNLAYFGVDLDAMLKAHPERAEPLLEGLAQRLERGDIGPLVHRVFRGSDVVEAFRTMQRSEHLGKLVVTPPAVPAAVTPAPRLARPDGAWLITGGCRGFGLALAERLVERGARCLWLTNRSGRVGADAAETLARLQRAGARVEVVTADAADEAEMQALLHRINAEGTPLQGVAHAAMVLDDALFDDVDGDRLMVSLRPKLQGAAILDRLTRELKLEHFLLFSSVAALLGNPGQTAYVAANAGLEAVAKARVAVGLSALAIQWGPIADVGLLAVDGSTRDHVERRGAGLMSASEALDHLEAALDGRRHDDAVLVIAPLRWSALATGMPLFKSPLLEQIEVPAVGEAGAAGRIDLHQLIEGLDAAAALQKLVELFRTEAASILRQVPESIDADRPLVDLGFDSLMGVELKLSTEEKYGITLPVFALGEGVTLASLAARILAEFQHGDGMRDEREEMAAMGLRHVSGGAAEVVRDLLQADGGGR